MYLYKYDVCRIDNTDNKSLYNLYIMIQYMYIFNVTNRPNINYM